MSTQHSPAPWHSAGPNILTADGRLLATFRAAAFPVVAGVGGMLPADENARIAAAGPALLAALVDADDFIDRNLRWGKMDEKCRVDLTEALKRVRAAIAAVTTGWDRSGCLEKVCHCHDETATPVDCSHCGCRAAQTN